MREHFFHCVFNTAKSVSFGNVLQIEDKCSPLEIKPWNYFASYNS